LKTIIIIGAGPAGLTAAYELTVNLPDHEILVLEETPRMGGISATICHHGNRMDIGGHRFFSKEKRVMDWWASFLPLQGKPSLDDLLLSRDKPLAPGGPDPQTQEAVMLVRDRVSRIYYRGNFYDYPLRFNLSVFRNMGFFTSLQAGFSYLLCTIRKRKEHSLEDFYINRFGKVLYRMFFEGYTEKLWGRHPREISAEWGAQRVRGISVASVFQDLFSTLFSRFKQQKPKSGANWADNQHTETSLIKSFWYPKRGPGQLWEAVADAVVANGGIIKTRCKVTGLEYDGDRITAVTYVRDDPDSTDSGSSLTVRQEVDKVISSMPVKDLIGSITGVFPPDEIQEIAKGLPYRDFVTVGVLICKLLLENNTSLLTLGNIVPDCWIYVQNTDVKIGRIQIFNNWSPYLPANPQDTVWIGLEYFCEEGDDFWNLSDSEAVAFAVDELTGMGVIRKEDVLDTHREKVRKAYPAYFDTYSSLPRIISYLDGISNLYCVGRNGQHRYNNMDHSMLCAFQAVESILAADPSLRKDLWQINTEQGYHEAR
jgi:protoporphyrinogen oxidase